MSQRVASLYAEIGARTENFEKGAQKVKGGLTGLRSGFNDLGLSGVASFLSIGGAVAGVGLALKNAIDSTMKYAGEVRDLTIATGGNAEASSRLLQVLDDYEISAGDVTAAMRAMKEKGLTPTIDTLGQLADQFNAITDPAERLKFAQDNLGRSSAKFLNVLAQGGDKIRSLNDGIAENLILTDEDIQKTEQARLAMDAWGDAVQGVQTSLTVEMLPALTDIMNITNDWARATELAAEQGKDIWNMGLGEVQTFIELAKAERRAAFETGELASETGNLAELIEATDYSNIIQGAIEASEANEEYRNSQADIKTQIQELMAEKEKMYPWEKSKIEEAQAQINELSATYEENAQAYIESMEKKFAMMAIEKIAMSDGVEGYSEAEFEKAKAILTTTDIATAASFEQAQAMEMLTGAVADGRLSTQAFGKIMTSVMKDGVVTMEEVQGAMSDQLGAITDSYKDPLAKMTTMNEKLKALQNLSGQTWTYMFDIQVNGAVPNLPHIDRPPGGGGGGVANNQQFASGGEFIVPAQYGYEGFNMGGMATASAGEKITISSRGATKARGEGGYVINIETVNVMANNVDEFMMSLAGEL